MITRIAIPFSLVFMLISSSLLAEQLTIDKQVILSPGHQVMPYLLSRASNGDLIIAGSNTQLEFRAWAIRIAPSGEVRWEFLQDGLDGWTDRSERGQRFYSILELPDQTTLLCGIKVINFQRSILLDHLSVDGSLIEERVIRPDRQKSPIEFANCIRWNDGFALIGAVTGDPAGTEWLAKLDWQLKFQWQKFGDEYVSSNVIEAAGGGFFFINPFQRNPGGSRTFIVKMGPTGEILARHALSIDDNPELVYPAAPRSDVRLALIKTTLDTEIIDLDDHLRGPMRVIKLHNAGVKKCVELPDGSIGIFGSYFHNIASAAVTRVYKDGSSKRFPVEPAIGSPWYYDATLTGNKNQFAAVRLVNYDHAVLEWISFR